MNQELTLEKILAAVRRFYPHAECRDIDLSSDDGPENIEKFILILGHRRWLIFGERKLIGRIDEYQLRSGRWRRFVSDKKLVKHLLEIFGI